MITQSKINKSKDIDLGDAANGKEKEKVPYPIV
jgi:hypothetical protein